MAFLLFLGACSVGGLIWIGCQYMAAGLVILAEGITGTEILARNEKGEIEI